MESADAFEWELSKENVAQLHGGRSVALLNKVLSAQNSGEFLNKRQQLRHLFFFQACFSLAITAVVVISSSPYH
ncbi:hypothetical protein EG68_03258 [Paragonimus skrjabini miyazakii]|uniref:Uncharacterized protein n=1 Tax=Paragonimus skrjabini miyazakii TaxID=59628 RepID=A0A8S9ZBI7_9TREM|nr:hypothetical protein EG68_03258 [Paragonimus skrjabini miyazakii]